MRNNIRDDDSQLPNLESAKKSQIMFPFLHSQRQKDILIHVTETSNRVSQKEEIIQNLPHFLSISVHSGFHLDGTSAPWAVEGMAHAEMPAWPLPVSSARSPPARKYIPPVSWPSLLLQMRFHCFPMSLPLWYQKKRFYFNGYIFIVYIEYT